jgi:hypothetical protein
MCIGCKEQIVNFHNFRQKVKKNVHFESHTEVIEKVKEFLNETCEDMMVIKNENSISIVPASNFESADMIEATEQNEDWPLEVFTIDMEDGDAGDGEDIQQVDSDPKSSIDDASLSTSSNVTKKEIHQPHVLVPGENCKAKNLKRKREIASKISNKNDKHKKS